MRICAKFLLPMELEASTRKSKSSVFVHGVGDGVGDGVGNGVGDGVGGGVGVGNGVGTRHVEVQSE